MKNMKNRVRKLRFEMGNLTLKQMAVYFDVAPITVCRWEKIQDQYLPKHMKHKDFEILTELETRFMTRQN